MAVARITIVQPRPGNEQQVLQLLQELGDFYAQQPGHIAGFVFRFHESHHDRHRDFGRIGVWESREAADAAARLTHTEALRSRLNMLLGREHEEWLVDVVGTPHNIPVGRGAAR